jgi:hypothetical protein
MKSKYLQSSRPLSLAIAALLGSITLAACGQFSAEIGGTAAIDQNGTGDGTGGNTSSGAGAGGPEEDIHVGPVTGMGTTPNPYAGLCGSGTCVIGAAENEECADTEACQLIPQKDTAIAECAPAGASGEGVVCQNAQDCMPGLGCAATPNGGGVCRSYCCGNAETDCPAKTYCAPQPMSEDKASAEPVAIPVCIPTTNCQLLNDATCTAGLTCAIVREDGTTSCIPPGQGQLNEPCPCAAGFVCTQLTNACKKLCRNGKDAEDCGGMATCQVGSAGYPEGYGVCVGGDY